MNNANKAQKKNRMNRRQFLGATAAAVSAFTIVPRHVLGGRGNTPPSEKLNIAGIGVGGQGGGDINQFRDQNIIALCDVDWNRAGRSFERFPDAKRYKDFRKMLDKEKNIDAVVVATPDHTHAVAAIRAIKMGKHVYVEKPLAHDISEVRMLTEAARKANVATQMGNQGRASGAMRSLREWIEDGAIGTIRKVETWTPHAVWPQGIDRPADTPPVPETLDWDLWLGTAPNRPYHPAYAPSKWRGWWDFGTGALGDMGCHIFDPLFYALQLTHPTSVEATCSLFVPGSMNWDKNLNTDSYPRASIVRFKFPARGSHPELEVDWYDGGLLPKRPEELEEGRRMGSRYGGALFIGDKGKILCGSHGAGSARIIPETKMKAYQRPPKKYPRSIGHAAEWIQACKGGEPAGSNFNYAGPLSETILLGNIAIRMLGKKILWDPKAMKVTNIPEANQYLKRQYRGDWSL